MSKAKIRSIRFSEEMDELINQQIGNNFTEKFERMVYNCYMLAPKKEQEIKRLDAEIEEKREMIQLLRKDYYTMSRKAQRVSDLLKALYDVMEISVKDDK